MPEGPEIETETLTEKIHEEVEHEGGALLKRIALSTALFAALAAIAALKAGATVNEALVLKTEATRLQAEASDQWAYYQAKGIKAATAEAARTSWLAIAKEPPAEYAEKQKRYLEEQKEIDKKAREKKERDEKSREADEFSTTTTVQHRRPSSSKILRRRGGGVDQEPPGLGRSLLLGTAATVLFFVTLAR
jgi:hypothetical protein